MRSFASFRHSWVPFRHAAALAAALLLVLLSSSFAFASNVAFKSTRIEESRPGKDGYWVVEVTITLDKAPDLGSVPMSLELTQLTTDKRYLLDGNKIQEKEEPLKSKRTRSVRDTVPFANRGTKVKVSLFAFEVNRDGEEDAGEYEAEVRDVRTGQLIGRKTKLHFVGKNREDDRRSLDMGAGQKKPEKPASSADPAATEPTEKPVDDSNLPEDDESKEDYKTKADEERLKQKPGGCGCAFGAGAPVDVLATTLPIGLALLLGRRRRR